MKRKMQGNHYRAIRIERLAFGRPLLRSPWLHAHGSAEDVDCFAFGAAPLVREGCV